MIRIKQHLKSILKKIILATTLLLPWVLKRKVLIIFLGYKIHPTCKIGFSWVSSKKLCMKSNSIISHFTIIKDLDELYLGEYSFIGKGNWITGYCVGNQKHYRFQDNRQSRLVIGEHSAITSRHIFDCTNLIKIGNFTTIAGHRSQFLTHSIDIENCRQWSEPINIGDYCFIGTNAVILGGCSLQSFSVLGAKSLLNKSFADQYLLIAGVPAEPIKHLPTSYGYFNRKEGYVW